MYNLTEKIEILKSKEKLLNKKTELMYKMPTQKEAPVAYDRVGVPIMDHFGKILT